MINFLKWLLCSKELATLHRYRVACRDADRWNCAEFRDSSATARWIYEFAEIETLDGEDITFAYRGISRFRDDLRKGERGGAQ